jgi:hypothetical protein
MKRSASLLAVLVAGLAGCGGGDDDDKAPAADGGKSETPRVEVIES